MQSNLGRARLSASQPLRGGQLGTVKPSGVAQAQMSAGELQADRKRKKESLQKALAGGPQKVGW